MPANVRGASAGIAGKGARRKPPESVAGNAPDSFFPTRTAAGRAAGIRRNSSRAAAGKRIPATRAGNAGRAPETD